jgi:2-oxoglutarate ferredoxin oxidoreductase subunit gamma
VLIALNLPSLQKFIDSVVPGGQVYVDSALISEKVERADVEVFYIPVTQMAKDEGIPTLANVIMLGHLLENNPELNFAGTDAVVNKLVPPKKAALIELNMKALNLGKEYK